MSKQRSQPAALPVYRAKLVVLSDQGVQLAVLAVLNPRPMGHTGHGALSTAPPEQRIKFEGPPNC